MADFYSGALAELCSGVDSTIATIPTSEKHFQLDNRTGNLSVDGSRYAEGQSYDPMGTLAWIANLATEQGRPLRGGMIVTTGNIITPVSATIGDHLHFAIDGIGEVELEISP